MKRNVICVFTIKLFPVILQYSLSFLFVLHETGTILSSVREITQIKKMSKAYNFRIKWEIVKWSINQFTGWLNYLRCTFANEERSTLLKPFSPASIWCDTEGGSFNNLNVCVLRLIWIIFIDIDWRNSWI